VIVGKSSGAKSGYVRVVNMPQSFLAAPLITLDADPDGGWITRLIDIQGSGQGVCGEARSGPAYTATRPSKEQSDFTVGRGAERPRVEQPGRGGPIAGSLAGVHWTTCSARHKHLSGSCRMWFSHSTDYRSMSRAEDVTWTRLVSVTPSSLARNGSRGEDARKRVSTAGSMRSPATV